MHVYETQKMKKIIVIGNGGTGKSTLSKKLSSQLSLPVYHLDQISWKEGWQRVDEQTFSRKLHEILQTKEWIIDGWSYHTTMRARFESADTIIFLDYPIWLAYYGATKRYLQYFFRQNPFDPPNSLRRKVLGRTYKAMWTVYKRYIPEVRELISEFKDSKNIHVFHSRSELSSFVALLDNKK